MREAVLEQCSSISPLLAARISLAVIGHVLYSKGQIPFPITQLSNIPTNASKSSSYTRALKKRDELLEAYEALDAQLSSALQQLSWTLALRAPRSYEASSEGAIDTGFASPLAAAEPLWSASQRIDPMNANQSGTLHIMVIVGASLNAPKARVVLLLHNFEIRPFGWREDAVAAEPTASNGSDADPEEDELNELAEQMANTSLASGTSYEDDEASESSEEEYINTSVVDSSFDSTEDSSVIRAPTMPRGGDPHDDDEDNIDALEEYEVLSIPSSGAEASPFDAVSRASDGSVTIHVAHRPAQTPSADVTNAMSHSANIPETQPALSPPKHMSTSSEAFIRKVERLVYRTLAVPPYSSGGNVAAEDDEELPLSQTTVLIRAPRRFKHASFLPRQTYSKELDEALSQCLSPSSHLNGKVAKSTSRGRALGGKVKTEGIRVSCDKAAAAEAPRCRVGISARESGGTLDDGGQGLDAEDEMIWWQWTGKLRGIGDELFGY